MVSKVQVILKLESRVGTLKPVQKLLGLCLDCRFGDLLLAQAVAYFQFD